MLWNPTQQVRELDTLFMPDLTSTATINAAGGFLQGSGTQAQNTAAYEFGPGKYSPAVRAKPGQASYVFYPVDGLIAGDEFTIEYWQRLPAWAANTDKALFAIQASYQGNAFSAYNVWNGYASFVASSPAGARSANLPVSGLGLTDDAWNHFAFTLKNNLLTIWVNGVSKGTITSVQFLPVWSDTTKEEGVLIGGEPGAAHGVWTSDLRISRTARPPGADVLLRSMEGSITMAANAPKAKDIPPNFVGGLHAAAGAYNVATTMASALTVPEGQESVAHVRTGAWILATPVKAGGTDTTRPVLGASGLFSYDWTVVDKTLDWYQARGIEQYWDCDFTPIILGGNPGFTPEAYTAQHPLVGWGQSGQIPTDFGKYATICGDLVAHAKARGTPITRLSAWNEPDQGAGVWPGTPAQMVDLWTQIAAKARAADPGVRCIGGEIGSPEDLTWIDAYLEAPQDAYAFHDYRGSLSTIDTTVARVQGRAAAKGKPAPPLVVGELNWSDLNDESGLPRFRGGYWHLRALVASYLTAYIVHALDVGGVERVCVAHTGTAYGNVRSGLKFATMVLKSTTGEHWAPYNAVKGWRLAGHGREIPVAAKDLPPGVHGMLTRVPGTSRYGVVLANWGWANRTARTVHIALDVPAGSYVVKRWLVDPGHSSRWDYAEDRPEGSARDALEQLSETTVSAPVSVDVDLPVWSSTFLTIEPTGTPPPPPPPPPPSGGTMLTAQHSFRGWFKTAVTGQLFSYTKPGATGVFRPQISPRLMVESRSDANAPAYLDGVFGLDDNAWHQFAVVKDGLSIKLAWDGGGTGRVVSGNAAGAITADIYNGPIGVTVDQFEDLPNTVLTDAQILQHFQTGHGTAPPPPPPGTDWQARAQTAESKLAQIHGISSPT